MAKVKYGAQVVNMSGKLGGQVYSHNASGAYVRNIGTIAVAPSAAILASQARFASCVAAWKLLSDAERTAWAAATVNYIQLNVFADPYTLNGFNLFMKVNNIRLMYGAAILSFPPFPVQPPQITGLLLNQPGGAATLEIDASVAAVPADTVWLIDQTTSISPTINNYKVLLANTLFLDAGDGLPASIYTEYTAKYGAPVSGMRMGTRVTPVHKPSGTPGQHFFFNLIFA